MTTTIDSSAAAPQPPLWHGLFGFIDKPAATFRAAVASDRRLRWGLPLLILLLTFAVLTVVQVPITRDIALVEAEKQLAAMPANQADAARETMAFTLSLPVMLVTSLGFGGLALVIGMLSQAAFLYFGALLVGGDDLTFGDMFTVSSWSRLPLALGFLVQAGFMLMSQGAILYPGLAALVSSGDPLQDSQNLLIPLLARVDLFWLWHLLLVGIGVAVAARLSRSSAGLLTVLYAALVLAIGMAPVAISMALLG